MSPERPRHLALLLPELEAGGAQRVMLLLAREFAARGHRVDLVLLRASGALLAEVPAGVRRVDLGARPHGLGSLAFGLSSVRRLAAWLRRERPDAMLSTITGANLVAVLARGLAAVPLRLVLREAVTLGNVARRARLQAMRLLYPRADAIVALSPVMAGELADRIGLRADRIVCIPNPIDAAFIRRQAQAPLAHRWLDDPALKVVVTAGRLIPQKDHATLLRAFALLPDALGARLVVVGEGPERPRLAALAAELGIADRVELAGFDPNPWRWMARADLFVLSSRWEGHPNALLEALALGLPAVVTEYDASVHRIAAPGHVSVVPADTPTALGPAIQEALAAGAGRPRRAPATSADAVSDYLRALVETRAGCVSPPSHSRGS